MLIAGGDSKRKRPLKTKRDVWQCTSLIPNISLNVAVIGKAGVGKSSFINAIRGFNADDERIADVASRAITDIPSYPHPSNSNVNFCKLPDIGTDRFPRKKYLDNRYHIFLLMTDVTPSRGHQPDLNELTSLGNEYHKQKKKFFFVRTKIGVDITTQDENAVMREIRESTQQHLRDNGWEGVKAFLIDSNEPNKFCFPQLKKCLIEVVSEKMINLKVAEICEDWHRAKKALLNGVKAATSRDAEIDVDREVSLYRYRYCKQLGLDEASLQSYAERTSTIYEELKSIVGPVDEETCKKHVDEQSSGEVSTTSTAAWCRPIQLIGKMFARGGETFDTLQLELKKLESAALEVVKFTTRQYDE